MEINISGLSDLQKLLETLPADIERKVMRGALRAGLTVIKNEAKGLVPVAPANSENASRYSAYMGALRDSIRVGRSKVTNGKVRTILVAGNKTAYYAHMVEFGTRAHFIRPKNKKSLFLAGLMREDVKHPGAKKKPFMRPALDAAAGEGSAAFEAVKAYLAARINKELAKLPDETDEVTK